MLETLFKSEALLGVLIGATFSFLGLLINTSIEAWKESRREKSQKLSEIRNQMGLNKGIQGRDVILYMNSQFSVWALFLRAYAAFYGGNVFHPDLSGANLTGASLRGRYLTGVDFSSANLTGADLREARLEAASFRKAILINADLSGIRGRNIDWEYCILYNTKNSEVAQHGAITNIDGIEKGFGKKISSVDEFENFLKSLEVDTTVVPIEEMYMAFKSNNR